MGATAHINFIAAAYAAAVIIIGALIAWVILDFRTQRQILAELDRQGISRRSGAAHPETATRQPAAAAKEQA